MLEFYAEKNSTMLAFLLTTYIAYRRLEALQQKRKTTMKLTTIKKPLAGALLCLFLLPVASGTETTFNICHPKYWEKATVDAVENIRDIGHTCAKKRTLLIWSS